MRVLLAGIAGGIAMFVWMSIAHTVLPFDGVGVSQMANEEAVRSALAEGVGGREGLYMYPFGSHEMNETEIKAYEEKFAAGPSGILIYHPPGPMKALPTFLVPEAAKELVESVLAAFLVSLMALSTFIGRVGAVLLLGVLTSIAGHASNFIWWGFPADFTLTGMFLNLVGYLVAGVAIAAVLGRRRRTA